ncbi:MAG: hypothetical protein AB1611_20595 [bacterium]
MDITIAGLELPTACIAACLLGEGNYGMKEIDVDPASVRLINFIAREDCKAVYL